MYAHLVTQQLSKITMVATGILMMFVMSFTLLEPTVSQAITSTPFTIRQQVSGEISFLVPPASITMNGALLGITGGNATGTTSFVVQTNQATGYTVDISFQNSPAMLGEVTGSTAIRNYGSSTEPTYQFFGSSSAQFAYTAMATTSADLDQSFLSNGSSACNTGASSVANTCWMSASTSNFRIISRTSAAASGATSTLQFRVNIPNTPFPAVQSDFYTATATLTAVTQ